MKDQIERALSLLGVEPPVSLKAVKDAYRLRAKGASEEELKLISQAYRLIVDFVESYPFSFTEEEILKSFPEERLKKRFFGDPLWGRG